MELNERNSFQGKRAIKRGERNRMKKTCETCKENDCGLCDRTGRLVEDDDQCEKWKGKEIPEWKARMMNTFLAGH